MSTSPVVCTGVPYIGTDTSVPFTLLNIGVLPSDTDRFASRVSNQRPDEMTFYFSRTMPSSMPVGAEWHNQINLASLEQCLARTESLQRRALIIVNEPQNEEVVRTFKGVAWLNHHFDEANAQRGRLSFMFNVTEMIRHRLYPLSRPFGFINMARGLGHERVRVTYKVVTEPTWKRSEDSELATQKFDAEQPLFLSLDEICDIYTNRIAPFGGQSLLINQAAEEAVVYDPVPRTDQKVSLHKDEMLVAAAAAAATKHASGINQQQQQQTDEEDDSFFRDLEGCCIQ